MPLENKIDSNNVNNYISLRPETKERRLLTSSGILPLTPSFPHLPFCRAIWLSCGSLFLLLLPKSIVTLTLFLHLFLHLLMKASNIYKLGLSLCSFFVLVVDILWSARIWLFAYLYLYNSLCFHINPWTSGKQILFYFPLWRNLVVLNSFKCEFHWNKIKFYARRNTWLFNNPRFLKYI